MKDLQEAGSGDMDWTELVQDEERWRECGNKPLGSTKCGEFLD